MNYVPQSRRGGNLLVSRFPLLDRRGRRERLSLIASGGVVDKFKLAQRSLLFRCLIYHPVCANKEGGLFFMAQPPLLSRRGNLLADTLPDSFR